MKHNTCTKARSLPSPHPAQHTLTLQCPWGDRWVVQCHLVAGLKMLGEAPGSLDDELGRIGKWLPWPVEEMAPKGQGEGHEEPL